MGKGMTSVALPVPLPSLVIPNRSERPVRNLLCPADTREPVAEETALPRKVLKAHRAGAQARVPRRHNAPIEENPLRENLSRARIFSAGLEPCTSRDLSLFHSHPQAKL